MIHIGFSDIGSATTNENSTIDFKIPVNKYIILKMIVEKNTNSNRYLTVSITDNEMIFLIIGLGVLVTYLIVHLILIKIPEK